MSQCLPMGAEELVIALQTPMRDFIGVPCLAWGDPGMGKSRFLESFHCDPSFRVHCLLASIHDPTDFGGLPVQDQGCVKMVAPEWAYGFDESGEGILFLDELSLAAPAVQAALLRVALERRVGTKTLPPGVRIAAAANHVDRTLGAWSLSEPLANRFVHLQWNLPGNVFADALITGFQTLALPQIDRLQHREAVANWSMQVAAFLKRDPSCVSTKPAEGEFAFATPRSWRDFAINLMASCECLGLAPRPGGSKASRVFYNLVEGSIGSGASHAFLGFLKSLQLPDPDRLLDGKETCDLDSLKDDEVHILFSTLSNSLLRRQESPHDNLLDATLVMLELVKQVNANGRIDTVFAPVRHMAMGRTLQKASVVAHGKGRAKELQRALREVFESTDLSEYVNLVMAHQEEADDELE